MIFGRWAKALRAIRDEDQAGQEAYKKYLREAQNQYALQKAIEERQRRAFTFADMQDIVKACKHGIEVNIIFADGATVKLRSADPMEDFNRQHRNQGEFF